MLLFLKYFDKQDLELIHLPKAGNRATFGQQIKILSEQTDSELVYFAEDDYFFFPNQFEIWLNSKKQIPMHIL